MKIIKYTLIISICLLVISCKSPEKEYTKWGISVTIPAGWKIYSESGGNVENSYLLLSKEGMFSDGLVSITWDKDSLDLNEEMEKRIEIAELTNMFLKVKYDSTETTTFNNHPALLKKYSYGSKVNVMRTTMYCFHDNNKTITFEIHHSEQGDSDKDKEAINKMMSSFVSLK